MMEPDREDALDRMLRDLRTMLAILILAGWSREQIDACVGRQYELAAEDPEAAAPVLQ